MSILIFFWPFQFFFTLSCADKRWAENFVSILTQLGHKVTFEKSGKIEHLYDDPITVSVDGEPMEDFLKNHYHFLLPMTQSDFAFCFLIGLP